MLQYFYAVVYDEFIIIVVDIYCLLNALPQLLTFTAQKINYKAF